MNEYHYYGTTFHFGSNEDDWLTGGPGEFILIGLDGDDTLISQWDYWNWSIGSLVGGKGDTTYYADGDITQIMDIGGNDTLHIPGHRHEMVGAMLNGQDLILANEWTGQLVIVLDFTGPGHIENFVDLGGQTLTGRQVESLVYSEGYGNITFTEFQRLSGDYTLSPQQFAHIREIDLVFANLNWDNVFQHLAERGSLDTVAIADAIQYEAFGILSPGARQHWDNSDMYGALINSQYSGIDQNIPATAPRLPQNLVEDMALLYQAALDREPDNAGLNYFVGNLREGQSLQDIANSFYVAKEFRENFDQFDDESYIDQLYLNVLKRPADQPGLEYWITDIQQNGRSHADVLVSFAQSSENRTNAEEWISQLSYDAQSGDWLI